MCGIVGVMGSFSKHDGLSIVNRMNETLRHRGPDDKGLFAQEGFAFGMCRLSIIDLTGGHQPMWTKDGKGIIFNGEIYNYKKLRRELESQGYCFQTKSDTEVILNLYHSSGIESIKKLEGMFAICLYDPEKAVIHLVRDRIGIKPLYYGIKEGFFYFASEIKAIVKAMKSAPRINHQSLHHYLTLRYVPSPDTIWEDIHKLEPGHYITYHLKDHTWNINRYWELGFESETINPERDYTQEFEKLLLDSVQTHLVNSDVPVGVLLSGGIDSSVISAAAVEMGHKNFHTFSVGFEEGGTFSELNYARAMAEHIQSQHHEIIINQKKFIEFIPELVRYSDEPLADLASIPLYFVSHLAREHVKVVLAGEGSDEIFAGYDIECLAERIERLKILDRITPQFMMKAFSLLPGRKGDIFNNLSAYGWSGYLRARSTHITNYWSEKEKEDLWSNGKGMHATDSLINSWYGKSCSKHPIDQLQQVYCYSWLVEDLLMKADRMSMANSLELRVPFLTHPIVEWASKLPLSWKVGDKKNGFVSKRILRDFARKRIPEIIIKRSKQGFPVPAYEWLRKDLGSWAEGILFCKNNFLSSLFNMSLIRPVLCKARSGDMLSAHKIWLLIILEQWGKCWM